MRSEHGQILYSATDLANQLGCTHASELDRAVAEGRLKSEYRTDPMLELLKELGDRHEQAYLQHLRGGGKVVAELPKFGDPSGEQTVEAMRDGADVIAQASLIDLPWRGFADFLIKVDRPSNLGNWSYEVADTKLSHTTKATAVLQLCLYSEIIAKIQGIEPAQMHVVKPGDPFAIDSMRIANFIAYYRMAKNQFESRMVGSPDGDSVPEPCSHCEICDWWPRCDQAWRKVDHLKYIAGISHSQRTELVEQGITTLQQFAEAENPLSKFPKRGSRDAYAKSQLQAKIQLKSRRSRKPEYEFNEVEPKRGFLRLPEPCDGDVFFDIEGNPRAVGEGLEYLFGYVTIDAGEPKYHEIWALNKKEEKKLFEDFIDYLMERWRQFPGMHVYHYAPYEPSALKRLATKHAVREDELDRLLRGRRLVDLYGVTRQGIRASVESYSIKKLEPFYGYERLEVLEEASKALREVERLIELSLTDEVSEKQRDVVSLYNQDDCLSTLELRNWLETLRSDLQKSTAEELPRPEPEDSEPSDSVKKQSEEAKRVFDLLTFDIDDEPVGEHQKARWLLAHMLEYFRREGKCTWWELFRMRDLEHEELLLENLAISGLEFVEDVPQKRTGVLPVHRYRFPPQEAMLEPGDKLRDLEGESFGHVVSVDADELTIDIKKRGDTANVHPNAVFEFTFIGPGSMPDSLLRLGEEVSAAAQNQKTIKDVRVDMLTNHEPRFRSLALPRTGDFKEVAIELASDLDQSYLAIQGPPGAGKTYVGSHMIYALAKAGKRVGISAVGHRVVINLLNAVHERAMEAKAGIRLAHQHSDKDFGLPRFVRRTGDKSESLHALGNGYVVGGTAWLWSDEDLEKQLDYLFIDEAGQMSLAMALAAGRAAKNVILLGDPQQLEQPQQATHPHGSGVAALSHLLNGADTMPDEKGLFLSKTWRLHPSICEFTSEQYYDGRLHSIPGLESQAVTGNSQYTGSGLRIVTVDHNGNQSRSYEEVEAISNIIAQLSDGSHEWSHLVDGSTARDNLELGDILVVAPYNAQVNALRAALPANVRVGTVDKFQGQEAPIVIYSMTSSSAADAPRGMNFLYNRNRMNVATSREVLGDRRLCPEDSLARMSLTAANPTREWFMPI